MDIIDITGEDGQQQHLEAPMNVLEELDNVAMTLMNAKPIEEVAAAKQPKTYSCEKCRMKFNTFQTLQDHNFSFKMMHSRV